MSSTAKRKVRSKSRKPQQGRKRRATKARKAPRAAAASSGMAALMSQGMGLDAGVLPEWKDLVPKTKNRRIKSATRKKVDSFIDGISTAKFAAVLLIASLAAGIYVRHVFSTQETLSQLEQMRRENLQLQLQYNQLKGAVSQGLSQNEIYQRARVLGLEPGVEFGATIQVVTPKD